MVFDNIKSSIEENTKSNFEPIIRATKIIDFLKNIVDVTDFQIMSFFDREIVERNACVRAVAISDGGNYGFIDKKATMQVFNNFDEIHGFSFSLLPSIAFMSKVDIDDVYIVVQDLKDSLQELYGVIPQSEIKYIDKSKLNTLRPNNQPNSTDPHLKQFQQIAELQAQLKEKDKRIAELEAEKQNPKKPEPLGDNYNPTERGTHLQAIAILAIREAERNPTGLMTKTGKIKNSSIADILAKEAKTLFTNPRDKDAFR